MPPSLHRDTGDLNDAIHCEGAQQDSPYPLAHPKVRRDPGDRDQAYSERQSERGRLAPRHWTLPRSAPHREDTEMEETGDDQRGPDQITGLLDAVATQLQPRLDVHLSSSASWQTIDI